MASGREIKTKIKSVQNTRKVTRALEMVSASKIRKAQDRMKTSRPYAQAMKQVIGHLAQASTDYQHPFLVEREQVKRVGFIVISSDRGLAGGLNNNLFRKMLGEAKAWQDKGAEVDLVTIGQKASTFFRRVKVNMVGSVTHIGDVPKLESLIGVIKVMLDAFTEGKIDRVYLVYNRFVNTMVQKASFDQLLPLPPAEAGRSPRLGLPVRTRCRDRARARDDALHRVAGVPGTAGKRRLRACGTHGCDEGGERQRQQADRHPAARLQQGAPGSDHPGNLRNRRRRGGSLTAFVQSTH